MMISYQELVRTFLSYAPEFNLQISPDRLTMQNKFSIGNRWTVRGFDGERNMTQNQGWYWRNTLNWNIPESQQQLYLGLDVGRIISNSDDGYSGRVLAGSTIGLRGEKWQTHYDIFAGAPLIKPSTFINDDLVLGFSLQWNLRR